MIYYNQNNYPNIPYPSVDNPNATVKSGGCGVTCAAMIIANMTGYQIDLPTIAGYAMKIGARVNGGTDMNVLAKKMCADYGGISYKTTNDENALLSHLKSGGMAVANVGGNRQGYIGVFSDGGHYVVAAGLAADGRIIILDPGYYTGKFNKAGRTGKVMVNGNTCLCNVSVLAQDTANRSPQYWLFSKIKGDEEDLIETKVKIADKQLNAYLIHDKTYVELRSLCDSINRSIEWDNNTSTATVSKENFPKVNIEVGNKKINGILIEDKTFGSLREIAEVLGKKVEWVNDTKTAIVK